jgi:hypothetical protein
VLIITKNIEYENGNVKAEVHKVAKVEIADGM